MPMLLYAVIVFVLMWWAIIQTIKVASLSSTVTALQQKIDKLKNSDPLTKAMGVAHEETE